MGLSHTDLATVVAAGIAVVCAAVGVVLAIQARGHAKTAQRAVESIPAEPSGFASATAQNGPGSVFQIGHGLALQVVPLRAGIRLSVTLNTVPGSTADYTVSYPITDEVAGQIAVALTRSHG